ncbi:DUF2490 domain-containing protein [Hymenobacter lutimineralis]|uniref:DUF2490 domain-containing protein n=1 Tax=Hymenobacter lutimineralis TaxID=2606448 RepID=A0A5D6V3E4_9BACT|nr:DUF2490 domain-containing protein [Hymenobacter lutimineralis]TYZ09625.1 DUF2490 domain-containing protein [Hymenobacter lutimineralis]
MLRLLCILSLAWGLLPCAGLAQGTSNTATPAGGINTGRQMWSQLATEARLTERWGAFTEIQLRHSNASRLPRQNILRAGLAFYPAACLQLSAGYSYGQFYRAASSAEATLLPEHRVYQQVLLRDYSSPVRMQHRYRMEQRWMHHPEGPRYGYGSRARYQLRLERSLRRNPKLEPGTPYVAASDELFFNLGRSARQQFLAQNRAYLALGYQAARYTALEIGYLYQVGQLDEYPETERNHTLQLALNFTPDFRNQPTK